MMGQLFLIAVLNLASLNKHKMEMMQIDLPNLVCSMVNTGNATFEVVFKDTNECLEQLPGGEGNIKSSFSEFTTPGTGLEQMIFVSETPTCSNSVCDF